MIIYLATWLEDNQGVTLTKTGAFTRLISYFFLKKQNSDIVQEYVETGLIHRKIKE
ncbi:MAG: hypothetical protein PHO27_12220 [Sulfuricurvum sp.]|jgi:hypothetical protein|nr:hypothetical protein [Sulfuricurvum sp.]